MASLCWPTDGTAPMEGSRPTTFTGGTSARKLPAGEATSASVPGGELGVLQELFGERIFALAIPTLSNNSSASDLDKRGERRLDDLAQLGVVGDAPGWSRTARR